MFETIAPPPRPTTLRRTALGIAVGMHSSALLLMFSSSLMAIQPIQAPLPFVVYETPLGGPPPPLGVPEPRKPAAKSEAKSATVATPRPELAPPVAIPEPVATRPANDLAPSDLANASNEAQSVGTPHGVVGSVGTSERHDVSFLPARPADVIHPVGGDVQAPRILEQFKPSYPAAASAVGVEGVVIVQAIINENGRVEGTKVLRGHALLDQAALDAVAQWRFEPGRLNGRPVKVYFTLTVHFRLKRG